MRTNTLFKAAGVAALALIVGYGVEVWRNNRALPPPADAELDAAFERGVQWLDANLDAALQQRNPIIWWMVANAAAASQDRRLTHAYATYIERYVEGRTPGVWLNLFEPAALAPRPDVAADQLPYYNYHMLHGLTCDAALGAEPRVQAQYEPDFCSGTRRFIPACVTHQLMGVRLAQRSRCGDAAKLSALQDQLLKRVVGQLQVDPRVIDVYVQRLLMLRDSGAGDRIEPVWLQKFLDAQRADGGWADFAPLVPLPKGYAFGYSNRVFAIKRAHSGMHTTAQALWLLSMLREGN